MRSTQNTQPWRADEMSIANQSRNSNTSREISAMCGEYLGHTQASRLTAAERDFLWRHYTQDHAVTAAVWTTLQRIAGKLEGRRAVA